MEIMIEYTDREQPILFGHTRLRRIERDDDGKMSFVYACECGNEWNMDRRKTRQWNCGQTDCPYMHPKVKRLLNRQRVGRPSNVQSGMTLRSDRITFMLDRHLRDEFDSACMLKHTAMSTELRDMVENWLHMHRQSVQAALVRRAKEEQGKLQKKRMVILND